MLTSDFQKLSIEGVITLYELDATKLGAGIIRWHGHDSFEDWDALAAVGVEPVAKKTLIWQGKTYDPVGIESEGLEMRGDGRASTPTLSVSNTVAGQQGAISVLCSRFDDFAGARLTVITTMAKYLDAANFANGNPLASNEHNKQIWLVEQKVRENGDRVNFELSNPIDHEGQRIPSREMTDYCLWCMKGNYRGEDCGYTGVKMFTEDGTPTTDPALDKCGGRLKDCTIRFGTAAELPYGGFPAIKLI